MIVKKFARWMLNAKLSKEFENKMCINYYESNTLFNFLII